MDDCRGRLGWARMSWGKKALLLGALLIILAAGVGAYFFLFRGGLPTIQVKSITHRWAFVNETVTAIESTVLIHNPTPISATLKHLKYTICLNGLDFATGCCSEPADIPAQGDAEVKLMTYVKNERIPAWWVSHVEAGEKTEATISGVATVEALDMTFDVPFQYSGEFETHMEEQADINQPFDIVLLSLPLVGDISITVKKVDTSWGEVTDETTQLIHIAHVYNPNDFDIPVTNMSYVIEANGICLAEGEQPLSTLLLAKSTTHLTLFTYIDNTLLDDWWVSHIQNNETTHLTILIYITMKFTVPFLGSFTVKRLVYHAEMDIKTDILRALAYP